MQIEHTRDLNFYRGLFTCPITGELFDDPVTGIEGTFGCTYERKYIRNHLKENDWCPLTKEELTIEQLKGNRTLKVACHLLDPKKEYPLVDKDWETIHRAADAFHRREIPPEVGIDQKLRQAIVDRADNRGKTIQDNAALESDHAQEKMESIDGNSRENADAFHGGEILPEAGVDEELHQTILDRADNRGKTIQDNAALESDHAQEKMESIDGNSRENIESETHRFEQYSSCVRERIGAIWEVVKPFIKHLMINAVIVGFAITFTVLGVLPIPVGVIMSLFFYHPESSLLFHHLPLSGCRSIFLMWNSIGHPEV